MTTANVLKFQTLSSSILFIPRHTMGGGGVLLYHVGCPCICVCPSDVHPYFRFQIIMSKHPLIFTKFGMCIDILRSGLGLHMGKFPQFLTVICWRHVNGAVLSFQVFIEPTFCCCCLFLVFLFFLQLFHKILGGMGNSVDPD